MRVKSKFLILAAASTLVLGACVDPNASGMSGGMTDNTRARTGAVAGAVVGGLFGATRPGGDSKLAQAAVGAGLGAAIGGVIGSRLDAQAADLRRDVGNPDIGIVNTGSELVVTMPQDLLFATNSASLRPDLQQDLRSVANNLLRYPDTTIQVIGHTDNTGTAALNADLSQRRATSVALVLRDAGVPSQRIVAFGRGEDRPIASNLTPEGRSQNRRVEIIIRPNA